MTLTFSLTDPTNKICLLPTKNCILIIHISYQALKIINTYNVLFLSTKTFKMLNVNYNFTKKDNVILTNGGKGEILIKCVLKLKGRPKPLYIYSKVC